MLPPDFKLKTPITPKENMTRVFERKTPLWVPNMAIDKGVVFNPADNDRPFFGKSDYDWFGVHWTNVPLVGGQMVTPGTYVLTDPAEWVEKIHFPDLSKYDFTQAGKDAEANRDPEKFNFYLMQDGLFERWLSLCDPAEGLAYLYEDPDTARLFFQKMGDYKIALMEKVLREFAPIDGFINSDDWGTQGSMFISPELHRYLIQPEMKRIAAFAHDNGKYIDFHSCGRCGALAPDMVDMGADMWEAQGMNDLVSIRKALGYKLPIQIGMDSAYLTAPERTEEEIRTYIHSFVDTYAGEGGLLTSTNHPNNDIAAMMAQELYDYSSWHYAKLP